jgi:hypothetical protein
MTLTNKKPRLTALVTVLAAVFLTNGCSVRVADLTLVSTKNIDLSDANFDAKKGRRAKGEDCVVLLLGVPFGVPNLEKAVDKALETGGGNVMVDQVTYANAVNFIIAGQSCIEVEGTVLNTAATGGITNKSVAKSPVSSIQQTPVKNYQPVPVAKPAIETPALTNKKYQKPKYERNLKDCRYLEDDFAIAECAKGN